MPETIAAVLITYNDEARIRPCLEGITWADEVVVMDLGSTDATVAICREFTERIYSHPWVRYADPIRNDAFALAKSQWVLMLDPDERVPSELAMALRTVSARKDIDVVLVPFWMMSFGYRRVDPLAVFDAQPRFFRKGMVRWPPEVHGKHDLSGLRQLRLDPRQGQYVLHDGWQTSDEVLDKINRYTVEEAQLMNERGVRFSVVGLLRETLREAGRGFIYQIYRNGTMGVVNTGFAMFYRFCVWVRLWEIQGRSRAQDRQVERWGQALSVFPRLAFRVYRVLRLRPR